VVRRGGKSALNRLPGEGTNPASKEKKKKRSLTRKKERGRFNSYRSLLDTPGNFGIARGGKRENTLGGKKAQERKRKRRRKN